MRKLIYIFGLLTFWSCSSNNKPIDDKTNDSVSRIPDVPDTVLVSEGHEDKEFKLDLGNYKIDPEKTKALNGEWTTIAGEISFLNTTLNPGDKVIFKDTTNTAVTGWGTLVYNRAAKFYFTESASHIYDYYIDQNGLLNLVLLDYRNDDLSFKDEPEPVFEQLTIKWLANDQIKLVANQQKVELKK